MKKILLVLCALCLCACSLTDKEIEEKPSNKMSVTLTGDLLFEQGLYDWTDNYNFKDYFDEVKPYLESDLTIGNQEVPIGGSELGVSGVAFTFNAPYEVAHTLSDVGFDFLTLANNHSLDMGVQGIENTRKILDEVKIENTGMYVSEDDRYKIRVVDKNGIKVSILAYTYDTNQYRENNYNVPVFLNEYGQFDQEHMDMMSSDIKIAKKISDVVFVSMHWGNEFTYDISETQSQVASFLNEQGVDVVIGNHSHCIQPATTLTNSQGKQTIVFYSLGNFVSSAALVDRASPQFQNMYEIGAIAKFDLVKEDKVSIENIRIVPVVNHFEHEYTNFKLIPFKDYTEDMASRHYQREFNTDFNMEYLTQQIYFVYDDSGFLESEI